jgi:hypothetical protein
MRFTLYIPIVVAIFLSDAAANSSHQSRQNDASLRTYSHIAIGKSSKNSLNINKIPNLKCLSSSALLDVSDVVRGGSTTTASNNGLPKAIAGAIIFATIEKLVKIGLKVSNIKYPAQLGACIVLFLILCITDSIAPQLAMSMYIFLTPGAALLAKWFPIFFIPGLVLLPLSPPIGGTMDVSYTLQTIFFVL